MKPANAFVRRLLQPVLLCVSLLTAPSPANAELLTVEQGYEVNVRVIPRIGAFLVGAYQENLYEKCGTKRSASLLDWKRFSEGLNPANPPLAYSLPSPSAAISRIASPSEWDLITTSASSGQQACGYKARRVVITVRPKSPGVTANCVFKFDFPPPEAIAQAEPQSCTLHAIVQSNREVPFDVHVSSGGAPAVKLPGKIPEDFLIATLGDSFASGEGNPDVPKSKTAAARWMDERCHRSVYAGSVRAAVRLLDKKNEITNVRYKQSLAAGALTVVNFACSGALVGNGIDGPYVGVVPKSEALEKYPTKNETKNSATWGGDLDMQPQIAQLMQLLDNQGKHPKKTIDLMLVSGGGNDVLFGSLVTAMALKNIVKPELNDSIKKSLGDHFQNMKESYKNYYRLRLQGFNNSYTSLQTILVKYPDPTYREIGTTCEGHVEQGSNLGPLDFVLGIAKKFGQLKLEIAETEFIRKDVIEELNKALDDLAKLPEPKWKTLEVNQFGGHNVQVHGWCQNGVPNAFASQQRWFRTVYDSWKIQGNINGGFHPTLEFTDNIQGAAIADMFTKTVNSEPRWDELRIEPRKIIDRTHFIPPLPTISYPHLDTLAPMLSFSSIPYFDCQTSQAGCSGLPPAMPLGAHGAEIIMIGTAKNTEYFRTYDRQYAWKLRVDALPPSITCQVGADAVAVQCDQLGWLRGRELTITIADQDSGVQSASLELHGVQPGPIAVPLAAQPNGTLLAKLLLPDDGDYLLTACAKDAVGNSTGTSAACNVKIALRVDSTAPRLSSVLAYNVDWSQESQVLVPTIPVFGNGNAKYTVDLKFTQKRAPIACMTNPGCQYILDAEVEMGKRKLHETKVVDAAKNETVVSFATIRLPDFSLEHTKRSAAEWASTVNRQALSFGLRSAFLLDPSLVRLVKTRKPGVADSVKILMDNEASPQDQSASARHVMANLESPALVVSWLNLVSGATYAWDTKAPQQVALCKQIAAKSATSMSNLQCLRVQAQHAIAKLENIAIVSAGN